MHTQSLRLENSPEALEITSSSLPPYPGIVLGNSFPFSGFQQLQDFTSHVFIFLFLHLFSLQSSQRWASYRDNITPR